MARIIKANNMLQHASLAAGDLSSDEIAVFDLNEIVRQGRDIVMQAQSRAQQIIADALGQVENSVALAEKKGYTDGFARGKEEGFACGKKEAAEQISRNIGNEVSAIVAGAKNIIEQLTAVRLDIHRQATDEILQLAVDIAEKIIGRISNTDISAAKTNLEKALSLAGRAGELVVYVNPGHLEGLRQYCSRLVDTLAIDGSVKLVGDEQIEPGGVKVVSSGGQIDATIGTQLDRIVGALLGSEERRMEGRYCSERVVRKRQTVS